MLEAVTDQFERYKSDKELEQASQKQRLGDLMMLIDKYKEQIWAYERNEKYLT